GYYSQLSKRERSSNVYFKKRFFEVLCRFHSNPRAGVFGSREGTCRRRSPPCANVPDLPNSLHDTPTDGHSLDLAYPASATKYPGRSPNSPNLGEHCAE